tara:strand:- start:965 stop:1990 length:1026 start_codon:yes stop_codon:yes gene_type:complete
MRQHEKELFLARIRCGYYIYKGKKVTLYLYAPTKEQNYEVQFVFSEAYNEALAGGSMVEEELLEMLEEQGLWNEDTKERLEELEKEEEKYKKEIFEFFFEIGSREASRRELKKVKEEILQLNYDRHSYDFLTCDGIATFAQSMWLIENTTKLADGTLYDWEEISPDKLLVEFRKEAIGESVYRELARTTPWRNFWNCSKSCNSIFGVPAIDLSTEQSSLISFSLLYDNVYQSTECPPDAIVEDNDAIDGWILIQKEKQAKTQKEKLLEKLHTQHEGAKDIFVAAKDPEDAQRINALNSEYAHNIKGGRIKQMNEIEGDFDHYKFNDIQKDLQDQVMETGML